jgi:hypothetical protein
MKNLTVISFIFVTLGLGCDGEKKEPIEGSMPPGNSETPDNIVHQNEDMLRTTDEPVPGAATSRIRLEYPKITRVTGTVVKRRNLMKMYEYYMISQDGLIYALAIQDPPEGGLDKSYDAIGVRMVANAEYSRQLEQRAKESLRRRPFCAA